VTRVKFCSACGSPRIDTRIPEGDTLPRLVCADCATIHYQNPKIVVGCLPEWEDRVLLCKRAIEPRYGLWTLPAGFLENGETLVRGAVRETLEEARARVEPGELYTVISLPQINQVYMMFRARLLDVDFAPGAESLDVCLFEESEVPWEMLAFRTIGRTLRNFFLDRRLDAFSLHVSAIERRPPLTPDLLAAG
jgi:ADP-ribose pyrophosphatase YjhB (NUDIX family)